jgi:hypothetical protein
MKRIVLALIAVAAHPAAAQDTGRSPSDVGRPPTFYGHPALKGCIVERVKLVASGNADTPLIDPLPYSAPRPGTANTSQQGPVNGPEPGSNPATIFTGYAFEYHSDLNGVNGCTSQQYRQYLQVELDKTTGAIASVKGTGMDPSVKVWQTDNVPPGRTAPLARSIFDLTTSSKPYPLLGGIVAEGTPSRIHWLDVPGYTAPAGGAGMNTAHAFVQIALLKSVTYGSNHDHGGYCLSGHTVVVDLATGDAMAPAAVTAMFGRAAAGKQPSKLQAQAATALRSTPANGGYQGTANPEFRELICTTF